MARLKNQVVFLEKSLTLRRDGITMVFVTEIKPVSVKMPVELHKAARRFSEDSGMKLERVYANAVREYIDRARAIATEKANGRKRG